MKTDIVNKVISYFSDYFRISDQLLPQTTAEQDIREGVSFRGTNIMILVLAILIASLGLNTNSTAVIIGAMLISPLMGPIIGIGLGVGICDFALIKRALRNLVMAAGFSVVASTIYFIISPVSEGHSELLARTSPTIYDVLIGFVGGFAGILAIGSTSKGNVIPGVAIATALMPPLCTAGYGLATLQFNYFFGASYLFIINSIYIAFATFLGVKLLRYKTADTVDNNRAKRVRRIVYTLAILTMLPSIWLTWRMLDQTKFTMLASKFVAAECVFPDTQVLSEKASSVKGEKTITITLIGRPLPLDSLRLALSSRLNAYGLSDTRLILLQGGNIVKQNASISGAEVGCQGEVGVACAMAAAAACQLFGGSPSQIEYAAEMGLEHHLGMTCDPVCGLVQIPCIERNAYAAARALDANIYASFSDGEHRVSFDKLVTVMKETGHDLPSLYKETGEGGLAKGSLQ